MRAASQHVGLSPNPPPVKRNGDPVVQGKLRQLAYILHIQFGIEQRIVCSLLRCERTWVRKSCAIVEDARDEDGALDERLDAFTFEDAA